MYNSRPDITKEIILEQISQEDIFEKYGIKVEYDNLFCSPLRDDDNPTCSFKWFGNKLYFKDWSEGGRAKDCFDVVKQLYQCTYYEALDIVAIDFGLMEGKTSEVKRERVKPKKEPVNLQITSQNFSTHCIQYWQSQGISMPTLLKYDVTSVRAVWIRGSKVYDWSSKDLAFAYKFGNGLIKIYFPLRKKGQIKFFNSDNTVIEGFNKLPQKGELLVITKSYKDVMALHEFEIPAVAPSSESVSINPLIIEILYSRFNNIFSLMDNDWPGRRAAIRLKKAYGIPPLIFPVGEPKDFTDNRRKYGEIYLVDVIEDLKKKYDIIA